MIVAIAPRRNWPGMLACALLGAVGGVLTAVLLLVFLPVTRVAAVPVNAGDEVYFIAGSHDETKAHDWLRKAAHFVRGGSVEVTEDELNAASAAATVESPEPELFTLGRANFRMFEGHLQVAVPVKVTALGLENEVLVQISGVLVRGEGEFTLDPHAVYIGSCALHRVPGAGEWLVEKLQDSPEVPAQVRMAWRDLRDARVDGRVLKLEAAHP